MSKQIIIGFTTEGTTDIRFLESIIQRSFENVALACRGQIDILPVQYIEKERGDFIEAAVKCAKKADKHGIMVFCIHADADDDTDINTFQFKINPAVTAIDQMRENSVCNNLVAVVPVQMTEAWMLSDTRLLKSEIGTDKTDTELCIDKHPERYNDPKEVIKNAIRIGRQELPRRRRNELKIESLYALIGQKISLTSLETLPSYQKFKKAVEDSFNKMNLL